MGSFCIDERAMFHLFEKRTSVLALAAHILKL